MNRSRCGSDRPFRITRSRIFTAPSRVYKGLGLFAGLSLGIPPVGGAEAQQLEAPKASRLPTHAASRARADLIRFPDGRLDVSLFFPDVESVPPSLWRRMSHSRGISLLTEGSTQASEARGAAVIGRMGQQDVRVAADPSELKPVGVRIMTRGEVRLAWYRRTEREALDLLADAVGGQVELSARVLVPDFWDSRDWTKFVAAIHRQGLDHVQVLSGDP